MNMYAVLADLVVIVHLCYLLFTVGGEIIILAGWIAGWRRVRNRVFRFLHLGAVLLVAVEALGGIWCPLTVLEWKLRNLAGQHAEADISFVGRLIRSVMFYDFPDWFFLALYVGFGAAVLATFLFFPPEKKRQKKDPAG